jgi:hypothetical protein
MRSRLAIASVILLAATLLGPPEPARSQVPGTAPRPTRGIDWAAAARGQALGGRALVLGRGLDRGQIDKTAIPILLPMDPALLKGMTLHSTGNWYVLNSKIPGALVTLEGTERTDPAPASVAGKFGKDGPGGLTVDRITTGWRASWTRFGVLYVAEIECDDLRSKSPCMAESRIRGIVGSMTAVVLGKAAKARAQAAGVAA